MLIQRTLGADIILAFDQPISPRFSQKKRQAAVRRTILWEEESLRYWKKAKHLSLQGNYQALYGIVHGGPKKSISQKFLDFVVTSDFPGIAVGGEYIGSDPTLTKKSLMTISGSIPDNKPVHALGLGGGPEGIFVAVDEGVDTFDNTSVTRLARTGYVFIHPGDGGTAENKYRLNLKQSALSATNKPISSRCKCYTCKYFSVAYLNHLFKSKELLGPRLATIHNLYFINSLMTSIRESILKNKYESIKKTYLGKNL
jgi:tRNA-guanine family transglycosylase